MSWLSRLLGRKEKELPVVPAPGHLLSSPIVPAAKFVPSEPFAGFNKYELESLKANRCPDCGGSHFREGPSGGSSTNWLCAICGSEFNIGPFPMGERISAPGGGRAA